MKNEFKRMQFLAGIITENNLYEEEPSIDFLGLSQIDDLINNELSKAEKEQPVTEIIGLTTAAFILAIPGIINGIFRIIKSIKDKSTASNSDNDQSLINFIIKFTEKMDGYLDTPFRLVLTPFIKDQVKRDRVAKFLKAITLLIMSMGIDITKSPKIMSIGKQLTSDWTNLVSNPLDLDLATIITKTKEIIPKLLS
jgi:hypothetical protein